MISIEYQLSGSGWADCIITDDSKSVRITASYLSDALGDLLSAVLELTKGESKISTPFWEEPGEYRWIFERAPDNTVRVKILEFPWLCSDAPNEEGAIVFETTCRLQELIKALFNTTESLIQRHGIEGYKTTWIQHEFPIKQYEGLKEWLSAK